MEVFLCQVSHRANGLMMAFGAGALLFAVAIEMFAAGAFSFFFAILWN
jgi:hypothetical protein